MIALMLGVGAPVPSVACGDKRHLVSGAEVEGRDDAPIIVDSLAPGLIKAVASIPFALFALFPAMARLIGVGIEEALDLQGLRLAIQLNAIMTRASVQPSTFSGIHAMGDVGDRGTEFVLVKRQHGQRYQS